MDWRNRIVSQRSLPVSELRPHPQNWRLHPRRQRDALSDAIGAVGIVQSIVVNQRTGHVVDGHLRLALAIEHGASELPATIVDLTEDEEHLVLATLDPIGALAVADTQRLEELAAAVPSSSDALREMLEELAPNPAYSDIGAPDAQLRADVPVSLRILCSQVSVVERALERAMMTGAATRADALVAICEAYLADSTAAR